MITNPYKVLGVPDGATEEECTRAYKRLAKKYHPDLNPNDKEAEKKMAEINAAYDQIKSGNTNTAENPFYGSYSSYSRNSKTTSSPDYFSSVSQYIKNGQYTQAINLLNNIEDRNAKWFYLSALANMSLGNQETALDHIRTAYAKEPDNYTYRQAYENISQGINPLNYNPFSSFSDFDDFRYSNTNQSNKGTVYTVKSRRGCLSRIFRIILIIIAIRLVIRLVAFVSYHHDTRSYRSPYSYSNQYEAPTQADDYFGKNFGEQKTS